MFYEELRAELASFIKKDSCSDYEFNEMALKLFSFQYNNNVIYQKFCKKNRVSPRTVKTFTDIPPVPIQAFKEANLSCSSADTAEVIFMTSGTTNVDKRGKNIHRDLHTWELSMKRNFQKNMIKGIEQPPQMVILFPSTEHMKNSSLATYLEIAKDYFGSINSEYVFSKDGFQIERLLSILNDVSENNEKVFLLGATFSFIQFLDYCKERHLTFQLPKGSVVMDTGGPKGKSREINPVLLKEALSNLFGVNQKNVINMYGMTELSSQFYDSQKQHVLTPPHWVKTIIINPATRQEVNEGEKGIILHYDLANINSVCALMTEDVGVKENNGFRLLGRAEGSEAKGCSLAVEEFISSTKGEI